MQRERTLELDLALFALAASTIPALAAPDADELANLTQHPVDDMASVPFQSNTIFNTRPENRTQNFVR